MNEKPETIQTAADARHSMPRLVRLLAPITPDPLLLPKWEAHPTDETKIIGRWAEDFSLYEITVPHQLRDSILAMQHALPDLLPNVKAMQPACGGGSLTGSRTTGGVCPVACADWFEPCA